MGFHLLVVPGAARSDDGYCRTVSAAKAAVDIPQVSCLAFFWYVTIFNIDYTVAIYSVFLNCGVLFLSSYNF